MYREYIEEILCGVKTYDARSYNTSIRGKICLIDTRTSCIIALADLVSTHTISKAKYEEWHKTGRWKNFVFIANPFKTYYAYEMKNPVKLIKQIKIEKTSHVWCEFNDEILNSVLTQETLF